jgi:hypothetical protein
MLHMPIHLRSNLFDHILALVDRNAKYHMRVPVFDEAETDVPRVYIVALRILPVV